MLDVMFKPSHQIRHYSVVLMQKVRWNHLQIWKMQKYCPFTRVFRLSVNTRFDSLLPWTFVCRKPATSHSPFNQSAFCTQQGAGVFFSPAIDSGYTPQMTKRPGKIECRREAEEAKGRGGSSGEQRGGERMERNNFHRPHQFNLKLLKCKEQSKVCYKDLKVSNCS